MASLPQLDEAAKTEPTPPGRRLRQRSLFGEILDWMLVPLLLVWPLSIGITYLVAQAIASHPFDQGLERRVAVLADLAQRSAVAALPLLRQPGTDTLAGGDAVLMQVRGTHGQLLGGDAALPPPPDAAAPWPDGVHLRDAEVGGQELRIAWRWLAAPAATASSNTNEAKGGASAPAASPTRAADKPALLLVQVAEGLTSRTLLARDIVRGVILPQFVIVPISILLVWFGLGQGIIPLNELQARIRRRQPDDLSPIDQREAPEEITPLVDSINGLLGRLEQSILTQKRFIADAAHQLKTPLAGLRMQAELAARQTDPQELRASLRQISLSVVRTTRLVNQLLLLARAENQGVAAHGALSSVDLRKPVRDAVQELAPMALGKGLELEFDAPDTPLWVRGHALLLHELTKNLVDNAIAYTPRGGSVSVRLKADATNWRVLLSVEDSGLGIALAERELVFRPFYRVLGTGHDGSGLGLSIVQEIARQHSAIVELADNPACTGRDTPGLVVRLHLAAAEPPG
ncbi:putative two-component sensor kinase [Thiomonas sp. X19]|uniref:sensor histidine kinase n=1 Tax=Thiomonas sp. X19 TaxID=1050370 RepID=UPI000B71E4A3|nr:sensor histidine kinase [Thiomonas sp. X19]SCC95662.1 putative two-component sensor kinase [Thiomonas sp. X19]